MPVKYAVICLINMLRPIYVPSIRMEHARTLVRQRIRLVSDQTRCKNRIWHFLMFQRT